MKKAGGFDEKRGVFDEKTVFLLMKKRGAFDEKTRVFDEKRGGC